MQIKGLLPLPACLRPTSHSPCWPCLACPNTLPTHHPILAPVQDDERKLDQAPDRFVPRNAPGRRWRAEVGAADAAAAATSFGFLRASSRRLVLANFSRPGRRQPAPAESCPPC
jgi:hypothetical protein